MDGGTEESSRIYFSQIIELNPPTSTFSPVFLRSCSSFCLKGSLWHSQAQSGTLCSFGILFKSDPKNQFHDRIVMMADPVEKSMKMIHNQEVVKIHYSHTVSAVSFTEEPDDQLPSGVRLYTLTVDFKADNYVNR